MNAVNRLIVLLASDAPSFCYYEPKVRPTGKIIPFRVLASVVEFAQAHGMLLNLVYGKTPLPAKHEQLIASLPHASIRPWSKGFRPSANEDALVVLDNPTVAQAKSVRTRGELKCILRVTRARLAHLGQVCSILLPQFKRINLILLDVPQYTQADYDLYQQQLEGLRGAYECELRAGSGKEFSALTDRLFLAQMRNCDAGVTHVTCGPNGKLYVCPGFYFADEKDSIGDLQSGIHIPNGHLLALDHAPLCVTCDAYHCKRCIHLNKQTTLEVNTPSAQQCTVSHIERNVSRGLSEGLRAAGALDLQPIPEIEYLDPFKVLQSKLYSTPRVGPEDPKMNAGADVPFTQLHEKELLIRILNTQTEIQKQLEAIEQRLSNLPALEKAEQE